MSLSGSDAGEGVVRGHSAEGGGYVEPELRPLADIIDELNERFGLGLGTSDRILVMQQVASLVEDVAMQQVALSNDEQRFGQVADDRLDDIVAEISPERAGVPLVSDAMTVEPGGPVMSEVYFGYDERLDRRVAIKVLRQPSGWRPDRTGRHGSGW